MRRSRTKELVVVIAVLIPLAAAVVWRRHGGTADGFAGTPADKVQIAK